MILDNLKFKFNKRVLKGIIMKKIFITTIGFLFIASSAIAQNFSMGVSLQGLYFDASGTETLKESAKVSSKDETGFAPVASIFVEGETATGQTLGLEVVPYSAKIGDGGMTNDDDAETSGTNTVDVNFKNMISLYVENSVDTQISGSFVKAAISHVSLETDDTVSTGSSYGDENIMGLTLGFGAKNDLPNGEGFYKVVAEISHFEGATFNAATGNKIELDDFQTAALRVSVGKNF